MVYKSKATFKITKTVFVFALLLNALSLNAQNENQSKSTFLQDNLGDSKNKIERIEAKCDQLGKQLTRIENTLTQMNGKLNQLQKQISTIQVQVHHVDKISSWFEQPPPTPDKKQPSYTPAP
jgi:TolA-binding protein